MRMLARLMVRHARLGICASWATHLAVGVLSLILCLYVAASARSVWGVDLSGVTFGDYLFGILEGTANPVGTTSEFADRGLSLPFPWLLITLSLCACTVSYPWRDALGTGWGIVVASGDRWSWWLATCGWVVMRVSSFWLVVAGVAAAWTGVTSGSMSPDVSWSDAGLLHVAGIAGAEGRPILPNLVMILPASVALCLFQTALSLAFGQVPGLAMSLVGLVLSVFSSTPWLMGSYLMCARGPGFVDPGFDVGFGLCLSALISLVSVVLGGLLFSLMDLVERERT